MQEALGVPVNYSFAPLAPVQNFFGATGDPFRYDGKADLEYLLSTGVGVALVYGDRDYRCNCKYYVDSPSGFHRSRDVSNKSQGSELKTLV